jgi:hypothetical protein
MNISKMVHLVHCSGETEDTFIADLSVGLSTVSTRAFPKFLLFLFFYLAKLSALVILPPIKIFGARVAYVDVLLDCCWRLELMFTLFSSFFTTGTDQDWSSLQIRTPCKIQPGRWTCLSTLDHQEVFLSSLDFSQLCDLN